MSTLSTLLWIAGAVIAALVLCYHIWAVYEEAMGSSRSFRAALKCRLSHWQYRHVIFEEQMRYFRRQDWSCSRCDCSWELLRHPKKDEMVLVSVEPTQAELDAMEMRYLELMNPGAHDFASSSVVQRHMREIRRAMLDARKRRPISELR